MSFPLGVLDTFAELGLVPVHVRQDLQHESRLLVVLGSSTAAHPRHVALRLAQHPIRFLLGFVRVNAPPTHPTRYADPTPVRVDCSDDWAPAVCTASFNVHHPGRSDLNGVRSAIRQLEALLEGHHAVVLRPFRFHAHAPPRSFSIRLGVLPLARPPPRMTGWPQDNPVARFVAHPPAFRSEWVTEERWRDSLLGPWMTVSWTSTSTALRMWSQDRISCPDGF